jgi:hypothetical protein
MPEHVKIKAIARQPKAIIEIKDEEGSDGGKMRQVRIDSEAIPGGGADPFLLMLAHQVMNSTKIDTSTTEDAEMRYNATVAALHDIAPVGALEGMLAVQLVATHMAAMDCCERLNKTNDRDTHAYNLNQVNKLSRTHVSLLEALNRHRGKGQQKVTVEHIHVHQGGQAIVGHVEHREGGEKKTGATTPCKDD